MFFLILPLFLGFITTPVKAIEPTPTLNPIEEKVRSIVVKNNVANETPVNNLPKSFFGTITQINNNLMVITSDNQNKVLQLSDQTTYINSKRQKTKVSEFKVGQTILAMSYINQDNSLDCRRIIATDSKSVENNNQIITGQIVDVPQSQTSIFAFTPFQNKDIQYQIKVDSKTGIIDTNQKKLKSSDTIVKGKKIIIVMHPDTENSQTFYTTLIISLDTTSPSPTTTNH